MRLVAQNVCKTEWKKHEVYTYDIIFKNIQEIKHGEDLTVCFKIFRKYQMILSIKILIWCARWKVYMLYDFTKRNRDES